MIPAIASATPASVRLLGRRRVVAHSQPTTRIGRGVLEQQRDADGQMRDGVVVAELRAGDRDEAVGDHGLRSAAGLADPAGPDERREDGHRHARRPPAAR